MLTPIVKAYCTDIGFRVTETAMQCYGGYGYLQRVPRGAVHARREDRIHLRRRQRHPGPGPRGQEAGHEEGRVLHEPARRTWDRPWTKCQGHRRAKGPCRCGPGRGEHPGRTWPCIFASVRQGRASSLSP
ncbi:MAG: hypothetical protein MZV49_09615 [Rhodopseudomonas palustris]|nr:hypothetical protein [Rhodopseudomonas palustris]